MPDLKNGISKAFTYFYLVIIKKTDLKIKVLKSYHKKGVVEAGCDEAGRGCLAGPVCAAAVILPENYQNDLLNDSKKLTSKERLLLRKQIENDAIDYGVAFLDNQAIDTFNILKASIMAMHEALKKLKTLPAHIIVDGNKFLPYYSVPYTCIIKGDGKYMSIAAASILAKTYRDDFMIKLHAEYDKYGWNKNMGYPTKQHRLAIESFGITCYHRKSFKLKELQLKIPFK